MKIHNPDTLSTPPGEFSYVARDKTQELVFVAGALPIDVDGNMVGVSDFEKQCEHVFANIKATLDVVGRG